MVDFLVMQNIIMGFFWEYFATISGNLVELDAAALGVQTRFNLLSIASRLEAEIISRVR